MGLNRDAVQTQRQPGQWKLLTDAVFSVLSAGMVVLSLIAYFGGDKQTAIYCLGLAILLNME